MPESFQIEPGELTVDEIFDALRGNRHVVTQAELLGGAHKVTLRHDGTVLYCDTPMTFHKHEDEDGMRACMLKMGYVKE